MSVDGYVTTPDSWPVQLADPNWSPESYGFPEFQARCDAVLTGRTTFEPALGADRWPWGGLDVFVRSGNSAHSICLGCSCCRCSSEKGCSSHRR